MGFRFIQLDLSVMWPNRLEYAMCHVTLSKTSYDSFISEVCKILFNLREKK